MHIYIHINKIMHECPNNTYTYLHIVLIDKYVCKMHRDTLSQYISIFHPTYICMYIRTYIFLYFVPSDLVLIAVSAKLSSTHPCYEFQRSFGLIKLAIKTHGSESHGQERSHKQCPDKLKTHTCEYFTVERGYDHTVFALIFTM